MTLVASLAIAAPASAAPEATGSIAASTATATSTSAADVTRLFGPSRYETAVEISATKFAASQPAVFVTTGADFPDALSAAAAAGTVGGPVLLTPTTWIPETVLAEIRRLDPAVVYVLGGPSVVSASVLSRIASIAPAERIFGLNRYETSRKIAKRFHPVSDQAFLATGRGYADALAASAAAGGRDIPTLLVDGVRTTLDAATLDVLDVSGVRTIWLAGGHGAVSIPIEQQLRTLGYTVKRYGGSTRYDTATAITTAFLGTPPAEVYLASGEDFPDALTAAAAAGQRGGALYLTKPSCVPAAPRAEIEQYAAVSRVVIGGTAVVSNAAATNTGCGELPPATPTWKTSGFTFSTSVEIPYLDRPPVNVHDPGIMLDSTGLRIINFGPGGTRTDHPVAYAQYGISALIEYQSTGEQIWLDRALRHAQRLEQIHTDRGDGWYFPYLFDWSYAGRTLKAPWWSAMAQGEALSLFVRLHEQTGDAKWRTAAEHTWKSLLQPRSASEPWGTMVEGGILWFEEYAGNLAPLKVLNGHIFATFGVYDYWKLTGDEAALKYLDGAATAVLTVMPMIRVSGGVSYYCWQLPMCQTKTWQNPRYHVIHSWQLDTLARLTGEARFTQWSDLLRSDWAPLARRSMPESDIVMGEDQPPM